MMMRNITIGLATATITIGSSTLSAPARYGHESGISKGSMGWSVNGQRLARRTHGFTELSPHERMHLRAILGERYQQLSPLERERLMGIVRGHVAGLTARERERLRANAREHVAKLTPLERERLYRRGLYYGRR